ncbi:RpiB/LacA/LacB family sugar-phosphate isomerase [Bradyrhizobium sp.]|uniref:RpiB/LacA/LacB family sugar-phosphate isomerase n=1 Tax=Bradyrhizobium sp. TaxID=376 RepID=UPI00351F1161
MQGFRISMRSHRRAARLCRQHNDANVLAMGGRTIGDAVARGIDLKGSFRRDVSAEDFCHARTLVHVATSHAGLLLGDVANPRNTSTELR